MLCVSIVCIIYVLFVCYCCKFYLVGLMLMLFSFYHFLFVQEQQVQNANIWIAMKICLTFLKHSRG